MEEPTMRGRHAHGPEYVERLQGSADAKRRAKIILQTITGALRVQDACRKLGICEQRLWQLRQEMLQAAVTSLETQPAGRRPTEPEAPEVAALKEQVARQQEELRAAQVREEIALALPGVVHEPVANKPPAPAPSEVEKKRRRDRGG
jgi:transposase-like protein